MAGARDSETLRTALLRVQAEGAYAAYLAASNAISASRGLTANAPMKIGVLRNFTIEPLMQVVEVELALDGIDAHICPGNFDSIATDALDSDGALARFNPDVIIMALWLEGISPQIVNRFPSLTTAQVNAETARVIDSVTQFLAGIRTFSKVPVLLNNYPLPERPALGILDAQREDAQTETYLLLNRNLRRVAREMGDVFIVDYLSRIASVGSVAGFDEKSWRLRRSPLGRPALISIGQEYAAFLRAIRGKVRKCVVVDCDNTLWGGIVGEDGREALQMRDGHPGSAYRRFQQELLNLYDRGTLLALCSKNNESDVLDVLRSHPDMLLKETHIAAHRINWDDKVSNLRAIAEELNISTDALVFVDDSPFECALVREQLPEVAVIELKTPNGDLVSTLARRGYFDSLVLSNDDKLRTAHFRAETERRKLLSSAPTVEEFLRSLEMVAEVGLATKDSIPRVAQLTQKTNQFNLTTHRYTEEDIRRFVADAGSDVLHIRLRDNVADLGIVAAAVLRTSGTTAEIDTFLISCRALGRGVELVMLQELRRRATEQGCNMIRGIYIPTAKNQQVADFYIRMGFVEEKADVLRRTYIGDVQRLPPLEPPIRIIRQTVSGPEEYVCRSEA